MEMKPKFLRFECECGWSVDLTDRPHQAMEYCYCSGCDKKCKPVIGSEMKEK